MRNTLLHAGIGQKVAVATLPEPPQIIAQLPAKIPVRLKLSNRGCASFLQTRFVLSNRAPHLLTRLVSDYCPRTVGSERAPRTNSERWKRAPSGVDCQPFSEISSSKCAITTVNLREITYARCIGGVCERPPL
ncbi:hypothetical protein ERJ75_001246600 [Trypanosoma vivax]|nr:hypothetical protein ERJ75_001246600 [Trypanosoma vivax]